MLFQAYFSYKVRASKFQLGKLVFACTTPPTIHIEGTGPKHLVHDANDLDWEEAQSEVPILGTSGRRDQTVD